MKENKNFTKLAKSFYDKQAKKYSNNIEKENFIEEEFKEYLENFIPDNLSGKTILDAGCGTGYISKILIDNYKPKNVYGIDISPEMLKIAKQIKKENKIKNLYLKEEDITNTSRKENSIDFIIASFSLGYIKDLNKVFKEFNRVLKKGGKIVFAENIYKTTKNIKEIKDEPILMWLHDKNNINSKQKIYGLFQTKKDYINAITNSNLTIEKIKITESNYCTLHEDYPFKDSVKFKMLTCKIKKS